MRWFGSSPPVASSSKTAISTPSVSVAETPENRWDATLQDELKIQRQQFPSPEDVPGCLTLMDEFFRSFAVMPTFRAYYRYGQIADTSRKWDDLKYCFSMKSEDPEVKKGLWIKRRAEWWAKRRVEGSSEDVWELRKEPPADFPPLHPLEIPDEATIG